MAIACRLTSVLLGLNLLLVLPDARAQDLPQSGGVQPGATPGATPGKPNNHPPGSQRPARPGAPTPHDSLGLKPLNEMTAQDKYKGEEGGLYGGGRNEPPKAFLDSVLKEVAQIQPRNAKGDPSPDGKIGLISFGMSNTTMEFQTFLQLAHADNTLSPRLALVDGAQSGQEGRAWATTDPDAAGTPWAGLKKRLESAGVSPEQVQVCWMLLAVKVPSDANGGGDYPGHADLLRQYTTTCLQRLKQRYPNLRLVFLSSRNYAGYATTPLNPEPYAYEYGFSVRKLILDQIAGSAELNFRADKGAVKAPAVLWGPYLWADGVNKRQDGLNWERADFVDKDGTHPSDSGRKKAAEHLLAFLKTDPATKPWFLAAKP